MHIDKRGVPHKLFVKQLPHLRQHQIENAARLKALGVKDGETYIGFLYRMAMEKTNATS